jgi:nicotinamidase-related amidase/alkylated DNA repair dioxygenase AlkB
MMKPLSALLVVNAQNEFLAPGRTFPKQHIEPPQQLYDAIGWLVQAARQQHRAICWITSQYGDTSHTPAQPSTPCCGQDAWDREVVSTLPDICTTPTDAEIYIVRQGYDAFVCTNLHHWLQQQQITRLSLCGVMTDICISHTAKTALQLGYEVEILTGATSASTQSKHLLAIRELERLGATTRNWVELLSVGDTVRLTQIAGTSMLDCAALSTCIDSDTFETLYREVSWNQMSHRGSFVPRLVALQGTKEPDGVEPLYRHPADEQPPLLQWTPTIAKIRQEVERRIGHPLNHCLIQLYRNGRDWIGKHADKTLDVMRPSFIVNVSIGTTRTMVFRPKNTQHLALQKLPLPHGSVFMLSLESNRSFYHEIEQLGTMGTDTPRISLTLRYIGTFYDPQTGAVWGIGAPSKTRAEAIERRQWLDTLSPTARLAQEKAEAERMVRLFRAENIDENFDVSAYQPGFDILNFRGLL